MYEPAAAMEGILRDVAGATEAWPVVQTTERVSMPAPESVNARSGGASASARISGSGQCSSEVSARLLRQSRFGSCAILPAEGSMRSSLVRSRQSSRFVSQSRAFLRECTSASGHWSLSLLQDGCPSEQWEFKRVLGRRVGYVFWDWVDPRVRQTKWPSAAELRR
jgi:hypothetical protein